LNRCAEPGSFCIKEGVPNRNGIRKHRVIDLEEFFSLRLATLNYKFSGDQIDVNQTIPTIFGPVLCGNRDDEFLIRTRLVDNQTGKILTRTGHCNLYHAIWQVVRTAKCTHPSLVRTGAGYVLPDGVCATDEYEQWLNNSLAYDYRVVVYLTGGGCAARWRALIAINAIQNAPGMKYSYLVRQRTILLRTKDCCCSCAIEQALQQPKPCFLVL
jgi:hypothetical protein